MSPAHYWLCRAILLLDRIPLPMKMIRYHPPPRQERWILCHIFGTNILIVREWFFRFAKEYEYRQAVKRSNEEG
jgi:hypothetical protein